MIKKLQIRFVLITMLSLLAVLALIIGGMNIVSYRKVVADADELLELLSDNKGRFPEFGGHGGKLPPHLSPELPYETRYFTVTLDSATGEAVHIDTGRIAAVDSGEAIRLAEHAKGDRGFVRQYRFLRHRDGSNTRLIFLDLGRQLDTFRGFLVASISISLAGYLVVFLLVLVLSNRVVRPISDSYEKQKRFITDAGHELKTPLTIIRADTDILEMELGENEWLSDIQKQTDRLAALTADLVYLARLEEAGERPVMIDFALSDVVTETAQSFLAPAQTQGKTLELSVTPMISMKGDERAMTQLVSILLDNALKHSAPGSSIFLSLEKSSKLITLSVTNTVAQPLDKVQLSRLFDRFYRVSDARSGGGHGIGLSIARAIVQNHSGRIAADTPADDTLRISAIFPER